jgi:hypothetical protein
LIILVFVTLTTFATSYRARMEEYFEAVNLKLVDREGGVPGAETLFIG